MMIIAIIIHHYYYYHHYHQSLSSSINIIIINIINNKYIPLDLNREDLVCKRANLDRIKEFSKKLQNFNKEVLSNQSKLPPSTEKHDILISEQKIQSNRQKAIEFSRNIPKPKVKSRDNNEYNLRNREKGNDGDNYDDNFDDHNDNCKDNYGITNKEENRILELEAKHKQNKIQMEAIRKSLGMK